MAGRNMKKKSKKASKPYQKLVHGPFEVFRYGNQMVMENKLSPQGHEKLVTRMGNQYPITVDAINELVREIREIATAYEPLNFLLRSFWHLMTQELKKQDDGIEMDNNDANRVVEYIQSVIVASPPKQEMLHPIPDDTWGILINKIAQLYSTIVTEYPIQHSFYKKSLGDNNESDIEALQVEAQLSKCVIRGTRPMVHDAQHFDDLLRPHNDILIELFGCPVDQLLGCVTS